MTKWKNINIVIYGCGKCNPVSEISNQETRYSNSYFGFQANIGYYGIQNESVMPV